MSGLPVTTFTLSLKRPAHPAYRQISASSKFNSFQKHRKNRLQMQSLRKPWFSNLSCPLSSFQVRRASASCSHTLLMPRDRKFSQTFPGCPNHHSTCNFTEIILWESISFHIISMYNKLSYFCYELNQIMICYSLCL